MFHNRIRRRLGGITLAAVLAAQAVSLPGIGTGAALAGYAGAEVASCGSAAGAAVIRGSAARVVYDSTRGSDVLSLEGNAFGAGWLQLPALFERPCEDGFSLSMRCALSADAGDYTRLFQLATVPFGTGNANGYNSPDISMDLNGSGLPMRASVFAGKGSTADEAQRAMFTVGMERDTAWHTVTVVVTPRNGAQYYLDGSPAAAEGDGAGRLSAACSALFSEHLLQYYTYNAIGHSLYTDKDLRARIDDVAFYDYALTAAQAKSLPDNPAYLYTFEADTVTESAEPQTETSVSHDGAPVESIPALQTSSPDGSLTAKLWRDARGSYYYSVEKHGDAVILPSKLGLVTTTEDLSSGFPADAPAASRSAHDETYSMQTISAMRRSTQSARGRLLSPPARTRNTARTTLMSAMSAEMRITTCCLRM